MLFCCFLDTPKASVACPTPQPTTQPTYVPTVNPTLAPTSAPSSSPTRYPIDYSNFDYEIYGGFIITGMEHAELDMIDHALRNFTISLTDMIHAGMDADEYIEYHDVVLNVTTINGYNADELINMDANTIAQILATEDEMAMVYLIECESFLKYDYLIDNGTYNRTVLELFVTEELNEYFGSFSVIFSVEFIAENLPSPSPTTAPVITTLEPTKKPTTSPLTPLPTSDIFMASTTVIVDAAETSSSTSNAIILIAIILVFALFASVGLMLCFLKRQKKHACNTGDPGHGHFGGKSPTMTNIVPDESDGIETPGTDDTSSAAQNAVMTPQDQQEGIQNTGTLRDDAISISEAVDNFEFEEELRSPFSQNNDAHSGDELRSPSEQEMSELKNVRIENVIVTPSKPTAM